MKIWYDKTMLIVTLVLTVLVIVTIVIMKKTSGNTEEMSTSAMMTMPAASGSRFAGKVVLVTGGTSGIGLAAATAFAQEGATVIVCGRTPSKWATAQANLPSGVDIEYRPCDVRLEADVKALIQYIVSKYGQLDIAVNAAGVAPSSFLPNTVFQSTTSPTGSIHYGIFPPQPRSTCAQSDPPTCNNSKCPVGQQTGASNFCENPVFTDGFGIFYCMKWECSQMTTQSTGGSIVNIASINAHWGSPAGVLYGAAKGMCLLLTRGVAAEVASQHVRVNCVSPGAVFTPLLYSQFKDTGTSYQQVNKILKPGIPLGRVALPSDIVGSILFLADSSQSGYVTGAEIIVDGAMTAAPPLQLG